MRHLIVLICLVFTSLAGLMELDADIVTNLDVYDQESILLEMTETFELDEGSFELDALGDERQESFRVFRQPKKEPRSPEKILSANSINSNIAVLVAAEPSIEFATFYAQMSSEVKLKHTTLAESISAYEIREAKSSDERAVRMASGAYGVGGASKDW